MMISDKQLIMNALQKAGQASLVARESSGRRKTQICTFNTILFVIPYMYVWHPIDTQITNTFPHYRCSRLRHRFQQFATFFLICFVLIFLVTFSHSVGLSVSLLLCTTPYTHTYAHISFGFLYNIRSWCVYKVHFCNICLSL